VGVTVTAKELFEGPTVRQMALRFPAQKSSEVSAIESERAQGGEPWEAHGLDKDAVVTLLERFPGAEHVMPLTPLQAWMVRESLVEGPHRSYINQAVSEAPGALPAESLRRAFSAVIGRHEALRCAFVMEGAGRPVQVVCRGSEMAVDVLDWSNLDGPDQHDAFGRFLREDRARGVDLLRPPLLRLSILQLSEASSRLVLTGHHAVMDGWSSHRVFDEVRRVMTGGALDGPVIPFRRFVEWLGRRDGGGARAQFSDGLAGYEPVPMLATVSREGEPDAGEPTQGRVASYLGAETSRALQEGARRAQVTQNTVFQAAWARTLARRIGRDDVVFGVTIAGRPESLAGASEIVGQCCSALPLRVRVPERVTPGWLRDLQAENAALRDHAGAAFEEFWSTGKALFDTHMIFESFPSAGGSGQGMGSGGAYVVDGWHMPLRVFVFPGQDAAIALHYDACSLDGAKVASLCDAYVEQLATVVGSLR
jgi:hypothetical protein